VEGTARGNPTGSAQFGFSNSGSLIYVPGPVSFGTTQQTLALFDRSGVLEPLKLAPGPYENPRISPDGKRIAFGTDDGKQAIIWTYDLSGASTMQRLTFVGNNRYPVWSADGKRIAFQSDREGDLGIFWQPADGTGTAERLTKPEPGTSHIPQSWSPSGDALSFETVKGNSHTLWILSVRDKNISAFGNVQSSNTITSMFSPNGRWLAYGSSEAGPGANNQIYVQPFPASGAKYQITKDGGVQMVWSRNGKELFVAIVAKGLESFPITEQPAFTVGNPASIPRPFTIGNPSRPGSNGLNFDITSDGKFLGVLLPGSAMGGAPQIEVVLNWFEDLKQRVPTH